MVNHNISCDCNAKMETDSIKYALDWIEEHKRKGHNPDKLNKEQEQRLIEEIVEKSLTN